MTASSQLATPLSVEWDVNRLAWKVALAVFVAGAWLASLRVRHLLAWSYDLAFYIQDLYAIRTGSWTNSIYGFGVFSDHISPILIPLAWLVPPAAPGEALVILQAAGIAAGIFPIAKLGMEIAGRRGALLACAWYAGSAAIWHALMYDFHPVTLTLPFGAWVLLEIQRGSRGRPWLPLLAMPLLREDVALLYGVVVVIAGWRGKRRSWQLTGSVVSLIGLLYMLIMRAQPGIGNHAWYRYQFTSVGELLLRPLRVDVLIGLAAVFIPLLIVPVLRGWRQSWPGLFLLASFAFSSWSNQVSLYYQYYAQAVPFLIAGAIGSFREVRWSSRIPLSLVATLSVGALLGPIIYIGYGPPDRYATVITSSSKRTEGRRLLALVPAEASVSATEMVSPALAWRSEIHPFPGPMICGNSLGYYVAATRAVDYILIEPSTAPAGPDWSSVLADWGYIRLERQGEIELWKQITDNVSRQGCPSWDQQKDEAIVG